MLQPFPLSPFALSTPLTALERNLGMPVLLGMGKSQALKESQPMFALGKRDAKVRALEQ